LLSKYNSVKGTPLKEISFSACIKMKEADKTIIICIRESYHFSTVANTSERK